MHPEPILTDYIAREIVRGNESQVNVNADLLATGILDSLGILQLVAFIEERFKIRVPDEDVVYENFYSITALSSYLTTSQARAGN